MHASSCSSSPSRQASSPLPCARPASAAVRTYHSFQYNVPGGINGGTPLRSSVRHLEDFQRLHASDPPVFVTLEEVCQAQALHIMATALSIVGDYDYSVYTQISDDHNCSGQDNSGVVLPTRGTPYYSDHCLLVGRIWLYY